MLDRDNILYVAHFSEQRAARKIASIGVTYPAYATSMGRVLLAYMPSEYLASYLKRVKPAKLTDRTETNLLKLKGILLDVRDKGYAIAVDQLDYGITALAVPIRDQQGRAVAAVNTSGYSGRITAEQLVTERLPELQLAAARISQTLIRFPGLMHSLSPANSTSGVRRGRFSKPTGVRIRTDQAALTDGS